MFRGLLSVVILIVIAPLTRADITLPSIIGDNMVLQRNSKACIWGWAKPGEEVTVSWSWNGRHDPIPVTSKSDDRGRWQVFLDTPDATGPGTMSIRGLDSSVTLGNIMVGEVWLCSGQSNMEWPLSAIGPGTEGVPSAEQEIAGATHPTIRLFTVPNTISVHERIDVDGAAWAECSPETAKQFSAVGYFFGRELNQELDVPIGLIDATWGGTVAQAWMSGAALDQFPEFASDLERLATLRLDPAQRDAATAGSKEDWWSLLDAAGKVDKGWAGAAFDDSGWAKTELPATWAGDLGGFDGVAYFRRAIDVPAEFAGGACVLELGPIDDYDDAFVNGVAVGATHGENQWSVARRYEVPAGVLKAGRNVVAVRVLDSAGPGGINGEADKFLLRPKDGKSSVSLAGEWRYKKGAAANALPSRDRDNRLGPNTPTLLYNAMIAPITPYTLRGAIWYQGESNRGDSAQYERLMTALIRDWRGAWSAASAEFDLTAGIAFYGVQIAPYRYPLDAGQTALLREAQAQVFASEANSGMAVTLDIGDRTDIHPANKLEVGRRLALLAMARTYGVETVDSGPVFKAMKVESGQARLTFESIGGGLEGRHGLIGFTVAGKDKQFHTADAEIDGDTVVVSSSRVKEPVAVRYAWSQTPTASLFNKVGLPAGPFRTDTWTDAPVAVEDDGQTAYLSSDAALKPIFNGTDLSGWVNVNCAPETWIARNGRILCTGFPTGVLRTEKMYQNFVLELEWRHLKPGGNAGLFVWSDALTARGQPFTRSVEVQVMDGLEGTGYTSDGDIFAIHGARMTPENSRQGSSRAFPTERMANFSPEWNHYRVECVDGAISLTLNGKTVTRGRDVSPRRGYICLESEGSPIEFRNIRIKTLPSAGYLSPDQVADADDGFVALYNGADLRGWKADAQAAEHWKAQDWTLLFDGQGADLWSQKSYKDFVLIADWRWTAPARDADWPVVLPDGSEKIGADGKPGTARVKEAGDSGIYLRGSDKAQVNMWCWPVGSGEVYGYRTDAAQPKEVRAAATPKVAADAPIGQWNRFIITMKGERLTVVLNGKTVVENARLPGIPREGPIALQAHGTPVQFSNIYIKELK